MSPHASRWLENVEFRELKVEPGRKMLPGTLCVLASLRETSPKMVCSAVPVASVARVIGFDVENTTEVIDAVMGDRCTYPARLIAERSATIKKPSDLLGSDGNRITLRAIQVTPTGVENPLDSQGNINVQHSVPLPVTLQSSILPSGLAEIVALWPALTDPQRSELLRLARAMID